MGFFDKVLGNRSASASTGGGGTTLTCDICMSEVPEDEIESGECEECRDSEYVGDKYCCGAIYEEGEDTCDSCGEPL